MNNYKIIFSDLKRNSEFLNKGYENEFVEYVNSFKGDNIFEKFKNILKCWENDVSYTLSFNVNDNPTKISLSYILSEFEDLNGDVVFEVDDITLTYGIPSKYQNEEIIPIYNMVKNIKFSGIYVDLEKLDDNERRKIINSLPAKTFNGIFNKIIADNCNIFKLSNEYLKNFRLNFLSNDSYMFLKGLFSNFDESYFRDVIFHLSKKIDGNILMNSTPLEIEYYSEMYAKELDSENKGLNL